MAIKRAFDKGSTTTNVTLFTTTASTAAVVASVVGANTTASAQTWRIFVEDAASASNDLIIRSVTIPAGAQVHIDTPFALGSGDKLKLNKGAAGVTTWVSYDEA